MKTDNRKLLLGFILVSGILTVVAGIHYFYHSLVADPALDEMLTKAQGNKEIIQLYVKLRDPHIYAGYDRFDAQGRSIVTILRFFDKAIVQGKPLPAESKRYMEKLMERYQQGTKLAGITALYLLLVTVVAGLFYILELFRVRKKG